MVPMVPESMMVFSGNANPKLAQAVSRYLNLPLGQASVTRFSDGEVNVQILENVRGKDVFILQSTCAPTNDNLMELMIMTDALKRASARRITAAIPYYGYARQDRRPRSTRVAISGGARALAAGQRVAYGLECWLTPFKPIDPAFHLGRNRIYHAHASAKDEDFARLAAEGHTVVNIHQGRAINPFINYPYSDRFLPRLAERTRAAHAAGLKLKVYYTTRELTQNMPEFMALAALDGEVILPRKPGVPWPVTNRNGPHPWLRAHLGEDFVPAWRETLRHPGLEGKLDLAVLTTPSTRWDNFYLAGLDYLVRNARIDGLYIDDTALDRVAMRRARRILDRDAPTRRLIDMHSWNHHNPLAAWANSAICFLELYPYLDSLWHGEGAFTMETITLPQPAKGSRSFSPASRDCS